VQNLVRRLPIDGETFDIQHLFFNFTIDNSTEFLLGKSINCQTNPNMEYFSQAWDYAEIRSNDRLRLGKLGFLLRDAKFDKSCKIVHSVVDDFIAETLNNNQADEMKSKRRYNLLTELAGQIKDPVQLRNELLNVLLAARDTTAGLLSSVMYFLSRDPEVWKKLGAEVDQLNGRVPDYDALKNMKYLKSVLDESKLKKIYLFFSLPFFA
jgi:cytochrome P450